MSTFKEKLAFFFNQKSRVNKGITLDLDMQGGNRAQNLVNYDKIYKLYLTSVMASV